jgi:hypothetical protein
MITYSWEINKVDKITTDGMTDVIDTVHWYAEATDGVYVVHEVGELTLESPDPDRFIEFTNLTKQDIVNWLHANLDTGAIQSSLSIKLQELQG